MFEQVKALSMVLLNTEFALYLWALKEINLVTGEYLRKNLLDSLNMLGPHYLYSTDMFISNANKNLESEGNYFSCSSTY